MKKILWISKIVLLVIIFSLVAIRASFASDYYVANSAAGTGNGSNCANADSYTGTYITTAGNWAGDVVFHLCGTITGSAGGTGITVLGSGTSGHPITIKFESGSILQSSYWAGGSGGAIFCSGKSYIVVDGGTNGVIQNTANGTALANQQPSNGVEFEGCSNAEIKNLTVQGIYVHTAGSSDSAGTGTTQCIGAGYNVSSSASGALIHNNTVSDCSVGIGLGYGPSSSSQNIMSASIYNNTINIGCHQISIGDGVGGSSATNISVYGNTIGPDFNTWVDSGSACHQDGVIVSAYNFGSVMSNFSFYNNDVSASACTAAGGNFTGYLFMTGAFSSTVIFNNVFHSTVTTNGCQLQGLIRLDPGTPAVDMTDTDIFNNTFDLASISNSSGASNGAIVMNASNSSGNFSGNDFLNNIMINFANSGGLYILTNDTGSYFSESTTAIDYDLYYNNGKYGHDDVGGQDYISYSDWTSLHVANSFPGYDPNGANSAPNLNSLYVPQTGSPAIALGTNLTSMCSGQLAPLCNDKSGNPRPSSSSWDSGAFNSSPSVTVTELCSVSATSCTIASNVSSGAGIVVILSNENGSGEPSFSVTDSCGDTYAGEISAVSGLGGDGLAMLYTKTTCNMTGGTSTISESTTGSLNGFLAYAITPFASSSQGDVNASQGNQNNTTSFSVGPTSNTSASDVCIAAANATASGLAWSTSSPWALASGSNLAADSRTVAASYRQVSSGTAVTASMTASTSASGGMVLQCLKLQ